MVREICEQSGSQRVIGKQDIIYFERMLLSISREHRSYRDANVKIYLVIDSWVFYAHVREALPKSDMHAMLRCRVSVKGKGKDQWQETPENQTPSRIHLFSAWQ